MSLWCDRGTPATLKASLFDLPATGGDDAGDRMNSLLHATPWPYLAVGQEIEDFGLGYYCLDYSVTAESPPLVYVPHPGLEPHRHATGPLASSFDAVLRINRRLFDLRVSVGELSPAHLIEIRGLDEDFDRAWLPWPSASDEMTVVLFSPTSPRFDLTRTSAARTG